MGDRIRNAKAFNLSLLMLMPHACYLTTLSLQFVNEFTDNSKAVIAIIKMIIVRILLRINKRRTIIKVKILIDKI